MLLEHFCEHVKITTFEYEGNLKVICNCCYMKIEKHNIITEGINY